MSLLLQVRSDVVATPLPVKYLVIDAIALEPISELCDGNFIA